MESNAFKNSADFINLAPRVTSIMRNLGFVESEIKGEGRALVFSVPHSWLHIAMVDRMALDNPDNTGVGLMYIHGFNAQDFMVQAYEKQPVGFGHDADDPKEGKAVSVIMLDHNWGAGTLSSNLTDFVKTIHQRDRQTSQAYIIAGEKAIDGQKGAPSADDLMGEIVAALADRIMRREKSASGSKTH